MRAPAELSALPCTPNTSRGHLTDLPVDKGQGATTYRSLPEHRPRNEGPRRSSPNALRGFATTPPSVDPLRSFRSLALHR
jgi:hypothetical protein